MTKTYNTVTISAITDTFVRTYGRHIFVIENITTLFALYNHSVLRVAGSLSSIASRMSDSFGAGSNFALVFALTSY